MRVRGRPRRIIRIVAIVAAMQALSAGMPLGIAPAAAQGPAALSDAQEVNGAPGLVAEIVQCKREAGVLSIRMRLRNTSDKDANVKLVDSGRYDQYYVTAGSKKYLMLRDNDKIPLATPANSFNSGVDVTIPKDGSYIWYAKYPAPPDDVKKASYYTPIAPPFEDIQITD